ncbi:MAG: hypothetical protein BGN93_03970 [Acinetobacter sp. 39-4]|nr:MAG: hypothetical protein BGN93_03970 [Acinetobacter sp. 39-4]
MLVMIKRFVKKTGRKNKSHKKTGSLNKNRQIGVPMMIYIRPDKELNGIVFINKLSSCSNCNFIPLKIQYDLIQIYLF